MADWSKTYIMHEKAKAAMPLPCFGVSNIGAPEHAGAGCSWMRPQMAAEQLSFLSPWFHNKQWQLIAIHSTRCRVVAAVRSQWDSRTAGSIALCGLELLMLLIFPT